MRWEVLFRGLVAVIVAAVGLLIAVAVYDAYRMAPIPAGEAVLARLGETGVDHPVTAVLLNVRAYDTFLELVVLTVAFWGAWSLTVREEPALSRPPNLLLQRVSALLVPALVMLAIYLLWAGSHRPGGEFQAGAVLGAAGILTLLVGRPVPGAWRVLVRHFFVIAGAVVFFGIAVVGWLTTGDLFGYPTGWEKALMLVVEIAAAVSIAFILVALFAGSVARLAGDVEAKPVERGDHSGGRTVEYRQSPDGGAGDDE